MMLLSIHSTNDATAAVRRLYPYARVLHPLNHSLHA